MNHKDEVYRAVSTLREMLNDRGVPGVDEALCHFSTNEIAALLQQRQTFSIDVNNSVRIIIDVGNKFKSGDVKKFMDADAGIGLFIIITKDKIPSNEQKKIADTTLEFQVFELRELQYNVSRHVLVPKHELITDEKQIEEVVKSHTLKSRAQLPIILKTDPQARYLNARPGNLVKVTRYCPSAGEHVVYRCCM